MSVGATDGPAAEIWQLDDSGPEIEGLDADGRADPGYASALGLLPARTGMRVLATLLELVVALLLALPGALAGSALALAAVADPTALAARKDLLWLIVPVCVSYGLILVFTLVQLILHGRKGVTLGKAVFGMRTVNVRTLERPGFWRGAVVRYLILGASFAVPLAGPLLVIALSPLFDPHRRGRGWPDRIAATWIVDVRRGLNPYDGKRMRIARKQLTAEVHAAAPALPSLATPMERDAPAVYVPTGRFSGGVIGAHRAPAQPAAPAAAPVSPVPNAVVAPGPKAPNPGSLSDDAAGDRDETPLAADDVSSRSARSTTPGGSAPALDPAATQFPFDSFAPAAVPASAAWQPPTIAPATTATPVPGPVEGAPAPAQTASDQPRAVLVIDDGQRIDVRTATLIGRAPAAAAGEGEAQLVRVPDETRSVSKTHVAILLSRRGVVAVDRGSTNGSSIVRDGAEHPLTPGHPAELRGGDVLRFGDRSLRVEQA